MIVVLENYSELAAAARAAAADQALDNVRRKHLIAADTWDGLARMRRRVDAARIASPAGRREDGSDGG